MSKTLIRSLLCFFVASVLIILVVSKAAASQAYIELDVKKSGHIGGQLRVSVTELQGVLNLDTDRNNQVSWKELYPHRADIEAYLITACSFSVNDLAAIPRVGEIAYGLQGDIPQVAAAVTLNGQPPILDITIDCSLSDFNLAKNPRRVNIHWPSGGSHQALLNAPLPRENFEESSAHQDNFFDFIISGVWHIWIGYDHILFLIALLIPVVLQRSASGREPVKGFGKTLLRVAVIVSAFTIAHSITLSLAVVGIVQLPPKLVESVIAASVALAALNNLRPSVAGAQGVWIALLFGLLHGFGFANVFHDVDAGDNFLSALVGFNIGVELGQFAIVAIFVPLAYLLRRTRFYRLGVVYGGSSLVALCACVWLVQRVNS
ncbi:HupE/UreJ family protein [Paraglaciecola sp. L1A13]|uniref:HupE/UreJ family protein n=1 Tax=Paraglaciecola sp. L1A13 TaxID=2686359 RepID=UPI00131DC7C6|nr:HupE/UreJ family protein [Paraglaciecola sp. L1A13]|tara:strand:+ start:16319 stop:17446 length:1128 start_codon:yes stop_codon:yes gene_type:complete